MISFTAFKLFILIVYVWFAVGIAVISVFAIRELFSWFKVPNEHISQSIQKGPRKNYEMKCNVVCIQTYPKMNQKEENLSHMETLLRKAMESHPDTQLIVFPELAVTGYQCGENFKDLAETAMIDSTSIKKMNALAKEFHVHIVYGMAEKKKKISFIILSFSLMTLVFFLELIAKFIYLIPRKIILHLGINLKYLIQRLVVSACLSVMTHSFQKLPEVLLFKEWIS